VFVSQAAPSLCYIIGLKPEKVLDFIRPLKGRAIRAVLRSMPGIESGGRNSAIRIERGDGTVAGRPPVEYRKAIVASYGELRAASLLSGLVL